MNKKAPILSLLILLSVYAHAGTDTTGIKTGIAINAGELVGNLLQQEMNVRVALEQRMLKHTTLLVEPGLFFVGSGFNIRLECKQYNVSFLKRYAPLNYVGIAYYHKEHFYSPKEIFYTDSTHSTVSGSSKAVYVEKTVTTFDILAGCISRHKYFYIDSYFGVGIRFKNIGGITKATYDLMEDNMGRNTLLPGTHILPDLTAGIRIGLDMARKHVRQ